MFSSYFQFDILNLTTTLPDDDKEDDDFDEKNDGE